MRRALLLAVLLAGCNAEPKPLAKGDPVLVDSGGKDVLVWTENPKHKDRADSIIIAGGSRAIFLDAEPAEGLVRIKLDRGPVGWVPTDWIAPDGVRTK